LPNGVTVELLGACDYPSEGKQWWRADGSPLAEAPYDRRGAVVTPDDPSKVPFEVALRVGNLPQGWEAAIDSQGNNWSGAGDPPYKAGRRLPELRWLMMEADPNQTTCRIRCDLAAPWQVLARSSPGGAAAAPPPAGNVVFSEIRDEGAFGTSVTLTGPLGDQERSSLFSPEGLERVVAIAKDGKMQTVARNGFYFREGTDRATARFLRLSLADVKEFQFQTRALTRVEFRHVPLRRGLQTEVQVDVRSADTGATAASTSSTAQEKEIVLPDVDVQPQMLDLATAKLVPVPTGSPEEIWNAVEKLGHGDLVYDSRKLILVRRAASPQAHPGPVARFRTYDIEPPLPVGSLVTTAEGRQYKITILAADDKACTLKYSLVSTDKGAGGGALVEPSKDGTILAFRIAPTPQEVGAELVEKYKQALTGGGRSPGSDFAWFEIRPGTTGARYQITCEHDDKTYVLLWNDKSHVLRADGTWGLEEVRETTDGMGQPSVVLTFDATGVRLFHALGDANLRHSLAVVFEGRVITIPFISTTLSGTGLPIIGRFTPEEIQRMVAALKKVTAASTAEIAGRVVDPNGAPVAGAQVALCTKDKGVIVQAGKLTPTTWGGRSSEIVEADAQGRFSFRSRPEQFHLVAAHDEGFAWVTNEQWTDDDGLRLEPWARIDGTLRIGREPGADKRVDLLNYINKNAIDQGVHFDYHTQTDARGRFAIEKVPPTWMEVGYLIRVGDSTWTDTSRTPIHLQPGEDRKMTLGSEGRPVVGRFVPPEGYQGPVYFGGGLRALDTWRPELPKPDNYDQMSRREQQEWINNWVKTPEAEAFYDAIWHDLNRRHYTFRIQEDGTFRIEDVTPGKYNLTVWLEERLTGQGRPEEIGGYHGTVEVPPMAQAYMDEPLDLGDLTLKMRQPPLHVGDMAPLFEAKTLDGKDLRLIDYRGKLVLLSFWEPAFHPELDRLKELYRAYDGAGKLQIIGLGGSDTLEEVREFVVEHRIEWPEIYFGPTWDEGVAGRYALPGLPYILLVDPEGKIVATWLRGEKLTEAVEKAIPRP
jgi:hypothetical protein